MTIQKLQEKYKEISKLIPAVETASNIEKIIGFYTSKIEQEGNWKKLKEWIEYLAQKDTIQAVLAINKLRKTTKERKEELISILLSSIEKQTDIEKTLYKLMITLLYLNKFDEASNLYKSLKKNPYKLKEFELEKYNTIPTKKILKKLNQYLNYKMIVGVKNDNLENTLFQILNSDEYLNNCQIIIKKIGNLIEENKDLFRNNPQKLTTFIVQREESVPTYIANLKSTLGIKELKRCLKEDITLEKKQRLLLLIIKLDQEKDKLTAMYENRKKLIIKFINEYGETDDYYTNECMELVCKLSKENEAIINFLKNEISLSNIHKEILDEYKVNFEYIYNKICGYKTNETKKTLSESWISFCDDFLKTIEDIKTEDEIRRNTKF